MVLIEVLEKKTMKTSGTEAIRSPVTIATATERSKKEKGPQALAAK